MNESTDEQAAADRAVLEQRAAVLARRGGRHTVADAQDMAVFRLGRERYAVDLQWLVQIIPLRDLALLPGARAPLVGLTPWRGMLLRVLDLGAALGRPHTGIADRGRVLVLGSDAHGDFGILIDAVDDVVALPSSAIHPLPGAGDTASALLRGVTPDAVIVLDGQELLRNFA